MSSLPRYATPHTQLEKEAIKLPILLTMVATTDHTKTRSFWSSIMAVSSSISCYQLKPPAPPKSQASHLPHIRGACVAAAAAACVMIGATAGVTADGGGGVAMARETDAMADAAYGGVLLHVQAPAPARWSDRRQCPPWRANSLENIVPENLPRPSARRRFNGITAVERAPAPAASPDAVLPFLALRSGMGCFSL